MRAAMEWKYSSMGVRSLAVGVASLPCAKEALAAMKPETRGALENPSSANWHDGMVVIDASEAVHRFAGDAGVEAMNFTAVKQSLGPIIAPFLKVTLALFGASPDALIKRMNDSIGTVMKGVRTEWQPTGPKAGRLVITHPDDVRDVSWPCWKGSLGFVFDLCGVTGEVKPVREASSIRTLVFDCSWK
jgi:hypothetical protein